MTKDEEIAKLQEDNRDLRESMLDTLVPLIHEATQVLKDVKELLNEIRKDRELEQVLNQRRQYYPDPGEMDLLELLEFLRRRRGDGPYGGVREPRKPS